MGVTVTWDDEAKTILRYDVRGSWTWDDLLRGREEVFKIMDAAEANPIYAIIHFADGKISLPQGGMEPFKQLVTRSHPKAGLTVVVGANWMMKTIAGTFRSAYTQITKKSVEFDYADTLEEARKIIAKEKRSNL